MDQKRIAKLESRVADLEQLLASFMRPAPRATEAELKEMAREARIEYLQKYGTPETRFLEKPIG